MDAFVFLEPEPDGWGAGELTIKAAEFERASEEATDATVCCCVFQKVSSHRAALALLMTVVVLWHTVAQMDGERLFSSALIFVDIAEVTVMVFVLRVSAIVIFTGLGWKKFLQSTFAKLFGIVCEGATLLRLNQTSKDHWKESRRTRSYKYCGVRCFALV